jgi:PPOX class probable F420-dependent enzyme
LKVQEGADEIVRPFLFLSRAGCEDRMAGAILACWGDAMNFAAFAGHKYLNLETFKKSGDGVKTPVWFAAEPTVSLDSSGAKLYLYTIGVSGKVKRMRNNPRVKIAPCDIRGNVLGDWVEARAEFLTGEDAAHAMRLLNTKYFPLKQILAIFAWFSRRERIVFVLRSA